MIYDKLSGKRCGKLHEKRKAGRKELRWTMNSLGRRYCNNVTETFQCNVTNAMKQTTSCLQCFQ